MSETPFPDHEADANCYLTVLQGNGKGGEICTLCYHHVTMFSVVTVRRPRQLDLVVCAACGNALASRNLFTPFVVRLLHDTLMRRLQFDMEAARMKREVEEYIPGEGTVH